MRVDACVSAVGSDAPRASASASAQRTSKLISAPREWPQRTIRPPVSSNVGLYLRQLVTSALMRWTMRSWIMRRWMGCSYSSTSHRTSLANSRSAGTEPRVTLRSLLIHGDLAPSPRSVPDQSTARNSTRARAPPLAPPAAASPSPMPWRSSDDDPCVASPPYRPWPRGMPLRSPEDAPCVAIAAAEVRDLAARARIFSTDCSRSLKRSLFSLLQRASPTPCTTSTSAAGGSFSTRTSSSESFGNASPAHPRETEHCARPSQLSARTGLISHCTTPFAAWVSRML